MKDIRISIRLTEEQHIKLKILAAKHKKSIQQIMCDYIENILKEK